GWIERRHGGNAPVRRKIAHIAQRAARLCRNLPGRNLQIAERTERRRAGDRCIALHSPAEAVDDIALVVGVEDADTRVDLRARGVARYEKAPALDRSVHAPSRRQHAAADLDALRLRGHLRTRGLARNSV